MKTSCLNAGLFLFLAVLILVPNRWLAAAEQDQVREAVIGERGPHHRDWQRMSTFTNAQGQVFNRTNHLYREVATGLNYWDSTTGQWLESKEEIVVYPGGGAATNGQHKVFFATDLSAAIAVDMHTPDGKQLQSRILGLAYLDTASGSNVLIAEIKSRDGLILPPNQVIYEDAFTDVQADVRYTYSRDQFEQDIIVRATLPAPEEFGLNSESTVLQVLTEFFSPPAPALKEVSVYLENNILPDQHLNFGAMEIGSGKAFSIGEEEDGFPITKEWVTLEGRSFLIEQIPLTAIAEKLNELPEHASVNPAGNPLKRTASLRRVLPARAEGRANPGRVMKTALARPPSSGLVLDYITRNSSQTNHTFYGDQTYYLSASVGLYGTNNTFQGGTVIKYASGVSLTVNTPVTWLGAQYRPVVMLAKDDTTCGESIAGATGNPGTTYYATHALFLNAAVASTNFLLQNLRIANARTAVAISGNSGHVLSHVQVLRCANGLALTNAEVSLRNALFDRVMTNFTGSSSTGRVEHLTSDIANWLNQDVGSNLFLTNCLLAGVTNLGSCTMQNVSTNASGSGVFQVAAAGAHYLIGGSTNRNAGTTEINTSLLSALRSRTTYPPIVTSNITYSVDMTFGPQAERDIDTPDLGYHYDPLDHTFGGVLANANITFKPGTAVGWFARPISGYKYGFQMGNNQTITFDGRQEAPNYFVRVSTVQEGLENAGGNAGGVIASGGDLADAPRIVGRFTRCATLFDAMLYRDEFGALKAQFRDSEFWSLSLGGYGSNFDYTNCLMESTGMWLGGGNEQAYWRLRNCTMWGGSLAIDRWGQAQPVSIRECAFDQTAISTSDLFASDPNASDYNKNAFISGAAYTDPPGDEDVPVASFDWLTGPLGNFYLPTNSSLIDVGGVSAAVVGLYHYTVTTNFIGGLQVKEGNSTVDIGYHYVAVTSNGTAIDTDGDGAPDYFEDLDGDGVVDSGETDWQSATDLGLKVFITRPKANSVIP